jgi:hypothetical protein
MHGRCRPQGKREIKLSAYLLLSHRRDHARLEPKIPDIRPVQRCCCYLKLCDINWLCKATSREDSRAAPKCLLEPILQGTGLLTNPASVQRYFAITEGCAGMTCTKPKFSFLQAGRCRWFSSQILYSAVKGAQTFSKKQ